MLGRTILCATAAVIVSAVAAVPHKERRSEVPHVQDCRGAPESDAAFVQAVKGDRPALPRRPPIRTVTVEICRGPAGATLARVPAVPAVR